MSADSPGVSKQSSPVINHNYADNLRERDRNTWKQNTRIRRTLNGMRLIESGDRAVRGSARQCDASRIARMAR